MSPGARTALALALAAASQGAFAQDGDDTPDTGGKLLLTAGVSQIEGAAGGGLTPWALIGGYGSEGQWGGNAFYTRVGVDDYHLDDYGVMVGWNDRIEFSCRSSASTPKTSARRSAWARATPSGRTRSV